jgi:outer membrane lipoprotein-sorting protein
MKIAKYSLLLFLPLLLLAQTPDAGWILTKVDENMSSSNRISEAEMIIHGRRGDRTVRSKSWIKGTEMAFTEYLAPAREKGTKMLKMDDNLWTYSPNTDRTILIAGHMLRQSVMGSDLSYEDLMEDPKLQNLYDAKITGVDTVVGRQCWVLQLEAMNPNVAYHARKIWVDQERFLTLKENRYAKSGRLIKTTRVKSIRQIDDRWVAEKLVFKDELKSGAGTEFILIDVEFDAPIPDYIFSKASLRR